MSAETIDHNTLVRLVEADVVRGAHVIGQVGGWGIVIRYGRLERPLAATRSKQVRTFKKLETLVTYLKAIGISQFDVDARHYDPATVQTYTRPDRTAALRQAQEAVKLGASYIVVGRPILAAPDPVAAAHRVAAEMN